MLRVMSREASLKGEDDIDSLLTDGSDEEEARCGSSHTCAVCVAAMMCCFGVTAIVLAIVYYHSPAAREFAHVVSAFEACSAKDFDARLVFPQAAKDAGIETVVPVATRQNIETSIPVNFTGIWWIRYVSMHTQWYNVLHLEEGVTFKGMKSDKTQAPWFPATLELPSGLSRHWMFSDTTVGKTAMMVAADRDPQQPLRITMYNATHGEVHIGGGGGAYIIKIDDDRWLRKNYMCGEDKLTTCEPEKGLCPDCGPRGDYELTRIVNEDGSAHPEYFPLFVEHMGSHKVRVFTEDNRCIRECGLTTSDCGKCELDCNGSAAKWPGM